MENVKEITEKVREMLRKPLPKEAIGKHPTKNYLSTIKAIYVTERLNDVFGVGSWKTSVREVRYNKGAPVVCVTLEIPEYGICYESYGGNDNGGVKSKNYDLGDAYKGATTDAITKIGSYLEIGIDVFKGQPATRVVEAKEQPKLKFDGAALTRLKEAVKNGTAIDMEMVLSKYTVSPKMKEKIEEVLNG